LDIEMILACKCRRQILKILWKRGRINIMLLVRKVNSTYSQVNSNLQVFAREGITVEERLGHKRVIRLNMDNPKTKVLLQVLNIFEHFKAKQALGLKQEISFFSQKL